MRIGFSSKPIDKIMGNPRNQRINGPKSVLEILRYSARLGLKYYDVTPEVVGWSRLPENRPREEEIADSFNPLLEEFGKTARSLDILISIHSRSSVILTSPDPEVLNHSISEMMVLRRALEICGGQILYVHPGYMHHDSLAARRRLVSVLASLPHSSVLIGLEVDDVGFGSLDLVLDVARNVPGVVPILDFAHLRTRGYGLESPREIRACLKWVEPFFKGHELFVHFSASDGRNHLPLDGNTPDYKVFAEAARNYESERNKEIVVLVQSPLREQDAMLMRSLLFEPYPQKLTPIEPFLSQEGNQDRISTGTEPQPTPSRPAYRINVANVIDVGSRVRLLDLDTGEEMVYSIVDPGAANPGEYKISYESPVGSSLIGKDAGSRIEVAAPGGLFRYQIIGWSNSPGSP